MKDKNIDVSLVRRSIIYRPVDGVFLRRQTGKIAVHINKTGYLIIKVGKEAYKAHRLAYVIMTGKQPDVIDHINQNKTDNRWVNLRSVSKRINCCNNSRKISATGIRGVHLNKYGRYVVQLSITTSGIRKYRYFGVYDDVELASLVASEVLDKYHEVPKCL